MDDQVLDALERFLSTLPARGATGLSEDGVAVHIISIHAPREGSDHPLDVAHPQPVEFLSTLPARGATYRMVMSAAQVSFLSTLPARGATSEPRARLHGRVISIHAPREGSDPRPNGWASASSIFLSTLPARGATHGRWAVPGIFGISIHAPREGSDAAVALDAAEAAISIHAPREGSDMIHSP